MGDPLLKVRAGSPLAISADTINTLIDVARDALGNAMQIGAVGQNHRPGAKAVWILNTTADHLKAGQVLGDHGFSLGVEYVSQVTRRAGQPQIFLHDLAGTLSLLDAAGTPHAGLLLDSFHWHCAGESLMALRALPASRIVAVHLADAPDRPLAQQVAFERALPGAGVADLRGFCAAVRATGYDGPATCEPFCKVFNEMPADAVAVRVRMALAAVMA